MRVFVKERERERERERESERRAKKLYVNVEVSRDSTSTIAVHHTIVLDCSTSVYIYRCYVNCGVW